jgi:hypothetical protein
VTEPIPYEFKSFALNSVNTHPTLPLVREQTRSFKDLEVSSCGLPGVLKDCRYFPSCHRAAVEVDREQHSPSGGVR